jgi:hypothetical protein
VRVENRKLTEAEWYLVRPTDPGLNGSPQPGGPPTNLWNPDYVTANPPPDRVVPKDKRSTREELIAITNSYFDAITSHDDSVALRHPGCGRVENGSPAPAGAFLPAAPGRGRGAGAPAGGAPGGARAGAPAGGGAPGGGAPGGGARTGAPGGGAPGAGARAGGPPAAGQAPAAGGGINDCLSGIANFNLSMVVARRIPLVDEEAQVTLALAAFIRRPGSPTPRNVFSEWFVIDEGKIRYLWAAMFYPPPTLAIPNWPPYDGNFPLPAGIVPTPAK